jgi:carboxymethylenebutenolidase
MAQDIELTAADGHKLMAVLATPPAKPRGGLAVIHEAFGVTDYIRATCDKFAADGYLTIAPAMYDRQHRNAVFGPSEAEYEQARTLRNNLNWDEVLKDVGAAVKYVSTAGKVGIVGYCVGGSVAWLAASHLPVAAASSYYGKDIAGWLGTHKPKVPIVVHFGKTDHLITMEDVGKIRAAYPSWQIHVYEAGHAFDNFTRESHVPAMAKLARERTLELFRQHVG